MNWLRSNRYTVGVIFSSKPSTLNKFQGGRCGSSGARVKSTSKNSRKQSKCNVRGSLFNLCLRTVSFANSTSCLCVCVFVFILKNASPGRYLEISFQDAINQLLFRFELVSHFLILCKLQYGKLSNVILRSVIPF